MTKSERHIFGKTATLKILYANPFLFAKMLIVEENFVDAISAFKQMDKHRGIACTNSASHLVYQCVSA